ncbi:replication initiation negative regulator SeqA [Shewanella baltica]|uniref:Negative modulator of initiation of replication n=1 Tax=Shewanella septentrionalis TaxID=2952223 RepID=A0A9X2WRP2_9GAMM|nr:MULTISPECIES: replication initiation negative regulator SeqA [Shewanella]MCS6095809.1 replication initiation negative regulator SeqA [Shewanella baltica]MCS6136572.1 replication initiation negative regulator SeqA [Shewanella baltica]MCS6226730.1 replication initiation negative regulator SeqA [Shewanella baltica]MCT7944125.1 replication initiation negative regulator SeqA [Shewanella septentrionalis]
MKYIEVDEELYRHIASKTERIGESASDILRRLLGLSVDAVEPPQPLAISQPSLEAEPIQAAPAVNDFSRLVDEHLLSQQKGAVGRFLFLLESLYQLAPEQFSQILQIQGRDRLYFARSKEQLLEASASANPKEIGTSGFWVTSNNNTAKKRTILSEVLVQFGCDATVAAGIAERV